MFQGTIVTISITKAGDEPMIAVDEVQAIAGKGLEGDRYSTQAGTFSDNPNTAGRQVTLIESEAIEALERDHDYKLDLKDSRRNIVTRGVPLNHLVGREFVVGDVRMRGVRLCEPCNHAFPDDKARLALTHWGGLRADILNDGVIRVGDTVQPATP